MWILSKFFVLGFLVAVLHNELADAAVTRVNDNERLKFTVFIGTKLLHENDLVGSEIVREVVGIGAIIGKSHVITTEEYMKWYKQPKIDYFVHLGSHDFDVGGQDDEIIDMKKPPQNDQIGKHTLVLLKLRGTITDAFGTAKISIDDKFLASGTQIVMVGIYQQSMVQLAWSLETIMPNMNCSKLLGVNTSKDKGFTSFGSHMCLVSKNLVRVDCKSHIGSIVVFKRGNDNYLSGIKSELHQPCSKVPYTIKYQRITPVLDWLKKNMV